MRVAKVLLGVAAMLVAPLGFAQIHEFEQHLSSAKGMHATVQCYQDPTPVCNECVWLDTYDPTNPSSGDLIVHTADILGNGSLYLITIKGTYSVWPTSWWVGDGQGATEQFPQFNSPGAEHGRVVADWEWLFGWYAPTPVLTFPIHLAFQGISTDGGVTYQQPIPVDGLVYNASHVYRYVVVGTGLPAFFKKHDTPTSDNYGRFKICVTRLNQCGND
jgi:hypothetical protein